MAESEVTNWGEELAWRQKTTWSWKKKKKKAHTEPGVPGSKNWQVKVGIGSIVNFFGAQGLRERAECQWPQRVWWGLPQLIISLTSLLSFSPASICLTRIFTSDLDKHKTKTLLKEYQKRWEWGVSLSFPSLVGWFVCLFLMVWLLDYFAWD